MSKVGQTEWTNTPAATECRTSTEANTSSQDFNSHGCLPVNTRSSFLRITGGKLMASGYPLFPCSQNLALTKDSILLDPGTAHPASMKTGQCLGESSPVTKWRCIIGIVRKA